MQDPIMIELDMFILSFRISCFVSVLESIPSRVSIHLKKIDGFKDNGESWKRYLGKSRAVYVGFLS
jgi:hypothetical protein